LDFQLSTIDCFAREKIGLNRARCELDRVEALLPAGFLGMARATVARTCFVGPRLFLKTNSTAPPANRTASVSTEGYMAVSKGQT
jgi:hypothetical protein